MSIVTIVAKVTIIARIMFRKICDFLAVLPTYELNESLSDNEKEDNEDKEDDEEFTCIFEHE
ncbi:hypothetical protein ACMZ9N_03055 [Gardnerella vaginalis]|uniref:hypothetical protein n=1 Tax=Gardnerella vaginalis TaxID=2702 RepID=UPI0039EE270C